MISDLFGVAVEEYYALYRDVPVKGKWFQGISRKWAEQLIRQDEIGTAEIATYGKSTGWLDGKTAATVRTHGSGLAYYIGAYLDVPALTEMFTRILEMRQIRPLMSTPTGVEVYRRTSSDGLQIGFLINHTARDQQITFPFPVYDYLTSTRIENATKLDPYGVIIFTRSE
jgi:beta-galactosidase